MSAAMKFFQAIRLGAMLKPQGFGRLIDGGATCAMGAALDACGVLGDVRSNSEVVVAAAARWPCVLQDVECPIDADAHGALVCIVVHLNDDHHWTREQIADWVETIEGKDRATETSTPCGASVTPEDAE